MKRNKIHGASAIAIMTGLVASAAHGQTATPAQEPAPAQAESGIADIVVTAQKRSERLSEVPMSITAATGEQLDRRGITTVADLVKITPGLTVATTYFSTPVYTIRGIGFYENSLAVSPTVSVYTDQIALPYSVMTQGAALDVQRVEILKGPQGTLFGQNSTGGAINYIPNKPTNSLEAGADFSYGNYNAVMAKGFISGPITSNLGIRVAGSIERRDPWQESQTRPGDKLGRQDFSVGRVLLDWQPTDRLRIELNVNGWVDRSETLASQLVAIKSITPVPPGYAAPLVALAAYQPTPRDNELADWDDGVDYGRNDSFWQTALRAELELADNLSVTSITSYAKYKRDTLTDGDGTPYENSNSRQIGDIKSFSQELRAAGNLIDNRLKWIIGANYARDKSHELVQTVATSSNSQIGPFVHNGIAQINNQDIETKAVFGSLEYAIVPTVSLQVSGRYTKSDNDHEGCGADLGNGLLAQAVSLLTGGTPVPAGACVTIVPTSTGLASSVVPIQNSLNEDNFSWRGSLSWKPENGTLVYANVTRGYKSGAFAALPAVFIAQLTPVPQESILAYEAGFKKQLFARTLEISLAGFRYDYDDKQLRGYILVLPFGNLPGLVTIPKSRVTGLEGSINWLPVKGLSLNLAGTYIRSKVTRDFETQDADSQPVNVKGEPFPLTPKWQITADIQYEFDVSDTLSAYVGISPRYQSASVAALGSSSDYDIPGYALLDLRVGLTTRDDSWRVEAWGRNVTNKYYTANVVHSLDTIVRQVGMPATYGVRVAYRF